MRENCDNEPNSVRFSDGRKERKERFPLRTSLREPRAARAVFRATILISVNFKGIFAKDGKRQLKSTGAGGTAEGCGGAGGRWDEAGGGERGGNRRLAYMPPVAPRECGRLALVVISLRGREGIHQ